MNDVKILAFEENIMTVSGNDGKTRTMPAFSENIMKLYGLVKNNQFQILDNLPNNVWKAIQL